MITWKCPGTIVDKSIWWQCQGCLDWFRRPVEPNRVCDGCKWKMTPEGRKAWRVSAEKKT